MSYIDIWFEEVKNRNYHFKVNRHLKLISISLFLAIYHVLPHLLPVYIQPFAIPLCFILLPSSPSPLQPQVVSPAPLPPWSSQKYSLYFMAVCVLISWFVCGKSCFVCCIHIHKLKHSSERPLLASKLTGRQDRRGGGCLSICNAFYVLSLIYTVGLNYIEMSDFFTF